MSRRQPPHDVPLRKLKLGLTQVKDVLLKGLGPAPCVFRRVRGQDVGHIILSLKLHTDVYVLDRISA